MPNLCRASFNSQRPRLLSLAAKCFFILACVLPAAAQTETVLHRFRPATGFTSYAGLVSDGAGNFYGTTLDGGSAFEGVFYKLDNQGHYSVLHTFTGGADGSAPTGSLIRDRAGNCYGVANQGGVGNNGVVFRFDASGQETVLYSFTGGADGAHPTGSVIADASGNLYGTAGGGAFGAGVVYRVDPLGNETVLYAFKGGADGGDPVGALIADPAGNLYGVTGQDTAVLYKLDPSGNQTVLHSFTGGLAGQYPFARVIRDYAGNLYGTTSFGGAFNYGLVYRVDPQGNETVLHSFTGGQDGTNPQASLVFDASGNLFGTTFLGGSLNYGTVFRIDAVTLEETVVLAFNEKLGDNPAAPVLIINGNIYGTTAGGGRKYLEGVIFKITPAAAVTK